MTEVQREMSNGQTIYFYAILIVNFAIAGRDVMIITIDAACRFVKSGEIIFWIPVSKISYLSS